MKNIIFTPDTELPDEDLLKILIEERDLHETTHVNNIDINELIKNLKTMSDAIDYAMTHKNGGWPIYEACKAILSGYSLNSKDYDLTIKKICKILDL